MTKVCLYVWQHICEPPEHAWPWLTVLTAIWFSILFIQLIGNSHWSGFQFVLPGLTLPQTFWNMSLGALCMHLFWGSTQRSKQSSQVLHVPFWWMLLNAFPKRLCYPSHRMPGAGCCIPFSCIAIRANVPECSIVALLSFA